MGSDSNFCLHNAKIKTKIKKNYFEVGVDHVVIGGGTVAVDW